jgi:arginine deiminase
MNFVGRAPGELLVPTGGDQVRRVCEAAGITCHTVEIGELIKAGGGIHCMTAFLTRDPLI